MFDEQGELIGYAHFSRDISERIRAENRLLTQQRAIAVLEDRAQIGQELHDRLGQVFGFLSLQSQSAQTLFAAARHEEGDRVLTRLAAVAQDAHSQVAQGHTYASISVQLNMGERTVRRHMKKILQLLHLSGRAEAEAYARRRGL